MDFYSFINFLSPPDNSKQHSQPIELTSHQKKLVDLFEYNDKFAIKCVSRQSGISTACQIYALWQSMFHSKAIKIHMSNSFRTARFIDRFGTFFHQLPKWMTDANSCKMSTNKITFKNGGSVSRLMGDRSRCDMLIVDGVVPDMFKNNEFNCDLSGLAKLFLIATSLNQDESLLLFRRFF